uniref:Cyclin-like domain-containing protein n=1 Tax=Glossina morsitans morsitans TaxID=37546 RepID=A0A1B0G543_GLOMM
MRFANRLQFGAKTHEVSMTALRIVQRMKKDSIHSGRRPTGLCGAALLIAARMHEFSRTIVDVVKIVKIHESTLRKRLTEFADTPSSSLTLDEFMSIGENELSELQKQIDLYLEKEQSKCHRGIVKRLTGSNDLNEDDFEDKETAEFIEKSNLEAIQECLAGSPELAKAAPKSQKLVIEGLKPDIESICRLTASEVKECEESKNPQRDEELDLEGLDDEEINNYILTHEEAEYKNQMWKALNAEYLKEMKEKEERLAKEKEEGKPEKKKRKPRKKVIGPSSTAGEAIEKMLQEKKISTKINYEILRTLTEGASGAATSKTDNALPGDVADPEEDKEAAKVIDPKDLPIIVETGPIQRKTGRGKPSYTIPGPPAKISKLELGLPVAEPESKPEPIVLDKDDLDDEDLDADLEPDAEPEPDPEKEYSSLKDMLNDGEEDDYYGYDEENY